MVFILCMHLHTDKRLEDEYYKDIPYSEIYITENM